MLVHTLEATTDVGRNSSATAPTLDPDLPLISARAALQVEKVIRLMKRGASLTTARMDAVERLAEMMGGARDAIKGGGRPLTASLLYKAFADATHGPLNTWQDLETATDGLRTLFQEFASHRRSEDVVGNLVRLRDFCIRLSDFAAARRQLEYGERPIPPFKR